MCTHLHSLTHRLPHARRSIVLRRTHVEASTDDDARPSPLGGATDECTDKTKLVCQALSLAPTSEVVCSHWAHLHPCRVKLLRVKLLQELAKNHTQALLMRKNARQETEKPAQISVEESHDRSEGMRAGQHDRRCVVRTCGSCCDGCCCCIDVTPSQQM